MAYPGVKGSFVLKVIIVVLAVVLGFVIYVPSQLWDTEETELLESQFRMKGLVEAQKQYFEVNNVYADSLSQIIEFANSNPEYRHAVDSLVQIISRQDSLDREKTFSHHRRYISEPVTIDSLYRHPMTGQYYLINMSPDDPKKYRIVCPVVPETLKVYWFFDKIIENTGWVNQDLETSW